MGIATGGKRSILHIQECCRFHYESDGKKESERIMRILIAEDNPVNQKLIELICRRKGYDTLIVPNGEAAVEAVSSGGFGLVLMDIMMPRMDGIEATRRIRSLPAPLGDTPIYAITAFASEENRTNCHERIPDQAVPSGRSGADHRQCPGLSRYFGASRGTPRRRVLIRAAPGRFRHYSAGWPGAAGRSAPMSASSAAVWRRAR
jgi:CheY-like chemotaxis protein